MEHIKVEMKSMTIGFTKVINGVVVTRWSKEVWEVGTFGRKCQDIDTAAKSIS